MLILLLNIKFNYFNPLYTRNPEIDYFANSEDPDEMQHNAAFHQGLHCLVSKDSGTCTS